MRDNSESRRDDKRPGKPRDRIDEDPVEREWDRLFKSRPDVLARLADEALAEHQRGETRPLDPDEP